MTDEHREFDLINRLFVPLTSGRPEALDLLDDAAVLFPDSDSQRVVTTDCLVSGVHFRPEDPPETVAARALRTNLSDIAAMGAIGDCYTMALAIPRGCDDLWLKSFAIQLARDQEIFGISLIGGDTVSTPGPLTITITALGNIPIGAAIKRSTARVGDNVYVSGHIGDAFLGLGLLNGKITGVDASDAEYLINRFWYPTPRTILGPALYKAASAMADVSDGLLADLGHICSASGVMATVRATDVPVSEAAMRTLANKSLKNRLPVSQLFAGGDDYELVFTAAPTVDDQIQAIARMTSTLITRIGVIQSSDSTRNSPPVHLVDQAGEAVSLGHAAGYEHRW